ncbi:MAG TPA: hypothetical protein PKZ97_19405, partial [Azospirillaceae bacterium]|nr:hypothetical protein [Azospirillaceae bacterium]
MFDLLKRVFKTAPPPAPPTISVADQLVQARDAAMADDYAAALAIWLPLAQQGNAAAEVNLGLCL